MKENSTRENATSLAKISSRCTVLTRIWKSMTFQFDDPTNEMQRPMVDNSISRDHSLNNLANLCVMYPSLISRTIASAKTAPTSIRLPIKKTVTSPSMQIKMKTASIAMLSNSRRTVSTQQMYTTVNRTINSSTVQNVFIVSIVSSAIIVSIVYRVRDAKTANTASNVKISPAKNITSAIRHVARKRNICKRYHK